MFFDYINNAARNAGWLAIKAGSSAIAKTVNTVIVFINWVLKTKAAWDVAVTNYTYINSNGAVTTAAFTLADGYTAPLTVYTDGTNFAVGKWNVVANTANLLNTDFDRALTAKWYAIIGHIVLKNASWATFTGWTTALDASNITATYLDVFDTLWI